MAKKKGKKKGKTSTFPNLIHVTRERPSNDKPYLVVNEDGVFGVDETTEAAVYKLVSVGEVKVKRFYEEGKKA